jgi:CarboxypepD_reg-like domain
MSTLTVQIPDPCRQRWDTMQAGEEGRFCSNCQKTVIDFTALSDRELVQWLNQPGQTTCGRFRPEQLNRPLPIAASASSSGWSQRLGLFMLGVIGWQTAQAQTGQTAQPTPVMSLRPTSGQAAATSIQAGAERVINGSVVSRRETGEFDPLPGVSVQIKGTSRSVSTDQSGSFQLRIPAELQTAPLTILARYIGFTTKEIELRPEAQAVTVILQEDTNVMGEVIVGSYTNKKLSPWQRFKRRLSR